MANWLYNKLLLWYDATKGYYEKRYLPKSIFSTSIKMALSCW